MPANHPRRPRRARDRTPTPTSVHDASFDDLASSLGVERATSVYRSLYRSSRPPTEADPVVVRAAEGLGLTLDPLVPIAVEVGSMATKHLFRLADGASVETVAITRRTGVTACVSSQVGCAFRCAFCASGQDGLARHLSPGEIVQQVLALGPRITRVVFMGIGEPLHNADNVLAAIRILRDRRGLGLSTRGITISTIGPPAALRRLREEHLAINLTVSLHATDDVVRHELIPGARQHRIADVIARSRSWAERHNRPVTYVYLLLPGVNDADADLARLVEWFADAPARVNLMRWNPVDGDRRFARADDRLLSRFRRGLVDGGVEVAVRDTQGLDVDAACGQLRARRRTSGGRATNPPEG